MIQRKSPEQLLVCFDGQTIFFSGDTKELTIKGGHLGPNMWPKAIDMIANGELPLDEIITHKLPISDFKAGIDKVHLALSTQNPEAL